MTATFGRRYPAVTDMVAWPRIVGLLLLLGSSGWAADRHVARAGADAGDCSLATAPCRTLGYAIAQALSGDTVKMAGGGYREAVTIYGSPSLVIAGGWNDDFTLQDPEARPTRIRALPGYYQGFTKGDAVTIFAAAGDSLNLIFDGLTITRGFRGIVVRANDDAVLQLSITRSALTGNIGGGLELTSNDASTVDVTIMSSIVAANHAGHYSGFSCATGTGAGVRAGGSGALTMSLVDTSFERNRIVNGLCGYGEGGGIWFGGGTLVVDGCVFSRNRAEQNQGGGLYALDADVQVTNTVFQKNTSLFGGGLSTDGDGSVTIANSILSGNAAGSRVFSQDEIAPGGGAMIATSGSITNTTFTRNRTGGIAVKAGSALTLRNSIVWGNGSPSDVDLSESATVDAEYNDIGVVTGSGLNDLGGNISADPLLASSDGLHLTATSLCVDAGTCTGALATDFEGDPRPTGTGCDIGADERVP